MKEALWFAAIVAVACLGSTGLVLAFGWKAVAKAMDRFGAVLEAQEKERERILDRAQSRSVQDYLGAQQVRGAMANPPEPEKPPFWAGMQEVLYHEALGHRIEPDGDTLAVLDAAGDVIDRIPLSQWAERPRASNLPEGAAVIGDPGLVDTGRT